MDELVKRLRASVDGRYEKCDGCPYEEDYPCCVDCLDKMHKQAADAIEELQKAVLRLEDESGILDELPLYQQPVGWIPVTEALPEHDKNVLICYEWTGRSRTVYREVGIASIEELERDPTEMFRPLYWMPLPKPPKEETK